MSSTQPDALAGRVFEAVLFDMDGTLVASTPSVNRSWLKWGAELGLDPSFRDGGHGQPARDIVASLVPADQVEKAFLRIQEIEISEVGDITPLPGSVETLASLPEDRKAIVTSCTRPLAAARIAAAGIVAPNLVVTADDIVHGKPAPDPFLAGAAGLGFDPTKCIVVEDATAGLISGRAAGCTTIAVVGTHTRADLDADVIVDSLTELRFTSVPGGIRVELVD